MEWKWVQKRDVEKREEFIIIPTGVVQKWGGGNANAEFLEQCLEMARAHRTWCTMQVAVTTGSWECVWALCRWLLLSQGKRQPGNPQREGRGRRT